VLIQRRKNVVNTYFSHRDSGYIHREGKTACQTQTIPDNELNAEELKYTVMMLNTQS